MAKLNRTEAASKLKLQFSSLKTKDAVTRMQDYVSTYPTHVVPKINKLVAMYQHWVLQRLSAVEPLAKSEIDRAERHLKDQFEPRFETLLNIFSEGKKRNDKLKSKIYGFVRHGPGRRRYFLNLSSDAKVALSISLNDTSGHLAPRSRVPDNLTRLMRFSEQFNDTKDFFVSLPRTMEIYTAGSGFLLRPDLFNKIETFIEDEKKFYLNDEFRDLIKDLGDHGVRVNSEDYRHNNLTWEKYYLCRVFPELASKVLDEQLAKVNKEDKLRNLRSLAAKNTDEQRNVARSSRSEHHYLQQIATYRDCPYCSGPLGEFVGTGCCELDHIHPVSKGGLSTSQNLVFICSACNKKKSNQTLNQFIISEKLKRDNIFLMLGRLGKDF